MDSSIVIPGEERDSATREGDPGGEHKRDLEKQDRLSIFNV
jgi:hypothetical protein